MTRAGDHREARARLQRQQQGADLIEHALSRDVALAPEAVEPRAYARDRDRQGGDSRQGATPKPGPRGVVDLQMHRKFVDIAAIGQHENGEIFRVRRSACGLVGQISPGDEIDWNTPPDTETARA